MTHYHFTLEGRFKPYVRMTQKGKFTDPQAKEYLASQDELRRQLKQQMAENDWEMLPGQTPLCVAIAIVSAHKFHNKDKDNQEKAILDAASGIVYPDDRWIDYSFAGRRLGEADVTELLIWPLMEA